MTPVKLRNIASQYGLDFESFKKYIRNQGEINVINMDAIADYDVNKCLLNYSNWLSSRGMAVPPGIVNSIAEAKELQQKMRVAAELDKVRQAALPGILISSGFNFDGYKIVKYSGYISGDDAIQINRDDLFRNNGQILTDSLVKIRIQALKELKEAAYDLGCNAVIGVDFDYMTFEPETISGTIHYYQPYVVCVTANGNAVVIEKNT